MRGKAFIWCLCFLLLAGCRQEPVVTEEEDVRLCISVRIPDMVQSKAGEELSPEENEALIQNLYIWVFHSDNGDVLGYIHPGQGQHRLTDFEDRYFITLKAEVARERPRVDVYMCWPIPKAWVPPRFPISTIPTCPVRNCRIS